MDSAVSTELWDRPHATNPQTSSPHDSERRLSSNRDLRVDFMEASDDDDLPPPAPISDASDHSSNRGNPGNDDTFDTLDDFGEDTLHVLMDSDVRLGKVPPLSSMQFEIDEYLNEIEPVDVQQLDDDMDEFEDDGTATDSLLRGPLMAAKSFASMNSSTVERTLSETHAQFAMSIVKPREQLSFDSPNVPTQRSIRHEPHSDAKDLTLTNCTTPNLLISSGNKQFHTNNSQGASFATRQHVMASPQDSISTMGSVLSMGNHVHRTNKAEQDGVMPSEERQAFLSSQVMISNELEDENDKVTPNASRHSAEATPKSVHSAKSSVERLLALGEKQMKQHASSISNTKKPFLKKGTRKEPSAIHTTETKTPTPSQESASDRKARLARLEKMQDDLRKVYERREARKKEAQRERKQSRTKEVRSQDRVIKSALEGSRPTVGVVTRNEMRAQSVSKERGNEGTVTPFIVRAKSAMKSSRNVQETPPSDWARDVEIKAVKTALSTKSELKTSPNPLQSQMQLENNIKGNNDVKKVVQIDAEDTLMRDRAKTTAKPKTPAPRMDRPSKRSASCSRTKQSKPASNSLSPKRSVTKDALSNEKAFEERKTKEGEEWAMIKNMRRRQEAALREAEGERERAKAWATAERESTKKWVEEQRAIINKARHKASNAALLASKREGKNKTTTDNTEATNEELNNLRSQINKLRVEAYEAKKLKEQVRKYEKTIQTLKAQVRTPNTGDKSTERQVLGDCTSSKTNIPAQQPNTPKNVCRKPLGIIIDTGNDTYISEEEDTNVWLERNLTKLNADNEKRTKANEPTTTNANTNGHVDRKPYNAADYTPNHTQSIQSPAVSHPNGTNTDTAKNSQFFTYQNGTQKEVLADGTTTVYFTNGDRKRTYASEKKGIVVYYYAATQTTQVTHQDGKQTYHFPNKQIEDHHIDGTKEISYPDGTKRTIYNDGTTDTTFPDGVRVVDYSDGRQQVHQVC